MKKLDVEQVNRQKSRHKGAMGFLEDVIRKFQVISFLLFLSPLAALYVLSLGLALTPLAGYVLWALEWTQGLPLLMQALAVGLALGLGFVSFILVLMLVVPIFNWPIMKFVKPYRGPWFALESIAWFYHNALFYLVRYTILDLVTPSPLSLFFLRAMGMKIGPGSMVNTSNISDPCLIEIGDHVTVGGSTYMMAHYGMKGFLIVDSLKIQHKANVGLHSYLMGAVEVGEYAQIYPNTMVLPKTQVPPRAKYGHPIAAVMGVESE